jgi:hypothetical protein
MYIFWEMVNLTEQLTKAVATREKFSFEKNYFQDILEKQIKTPAKEGPGVVVHACNASYYGGRGRRITA